MEPHTTYIKTGTDHLIWENRYSLGSLVISFEFLHKLQSRIARNRAMIQRRFRSAHEACPILFVFFSRPKIREWPLQVLRSAKEPKTFRPFFGFFRLLSKRSYLVSYLSLLWSDRNVWHVIVKISRSAFIGAHLVRFFFFVTDFIRCFILCWIQHKNG